jgi:hypothetical protein
MAPFFSGLRTSPVHDYRSRLKNHRQIFITACLNRCLDCELMCWQDEQPQSPTQLHDRSELGPAGWRCHARPGSAAIPRRRLRLNLWHR